MISVVVFPCLLRMSFLYPLTCALLSYTITYSLLTMPAIVCSYSRTCWLLMQKCS
nr:hypothetical protein Q903MT_gene2218 [Picea sitchensis]